MGVISDKIDWLRNGERANATNFNRALATAVEEIEKRLFNEDGSTASSTSKQVFDASSKGQIVSGDLVYLDPISNKLEKAKADDTEKANLLGICQISVDQNGAESLSVVTQGLVTILGKTLKIGKTYYLSNAEAGSFSTADTGIVVGIALKNDLLLIKASSSSGSAAPVTSGLEVIRYTVTQGDANTPTKITALTIAGVDKKPQQVSVNGTVINPERYSYQDGELRFVDTYVVYGDILTITMTTTTI